MDEQDLRPVLVKSIALACAAHDGQVDKGGAPYALHPLRVMEACGRYETRILAVLHDVVEDTETGFNDLRCIGVPEYLLNELALLTRTPGEDYFDYIEALGKSELAREVKMKDLLDNMRVERLTTLTEKDIKRIIKYQKAYKMLQETFN